MKKIGRFLRNPAPFALTAVNPPRKKRRSATRHRRKNLKVPGRVVARKVNPVKRRSSKRARRKNPLDIQHVIVETPAKNPARKRRKNPSQKSSSPMRKTRKRRSRKNRTRNPVRRSRGRSRRRNPARRSRSRSRRMRNPIPVISEVMTEAVITNGLGVLAGVAGTRWLLQTLINPMNADGTPAARMFDLPGVTYSTATLPMTQAQFMDKNKIALAFYEFSIPAVLGYFIRNKNMQFSMGLLEASIVNVGIAALRTSAFGQRAQLSAFLPRGRGTNTFIPGVPPMLSGPGTAFINNGSPVARGTGAVVNQRWHAQTTTGGPDPFKSN